MNSDVLQEEIRTTGAIILGRNSFDMADDPDWYAGNYEYQVPLFVMTHRIPETPEGGRKPDGDLCDRRYRGAVAGEGPSCR